MLEHDVPFARGSATQLPVAATHWPVTQGPSNVEQSLGMTSQRLFSSLHVANAQGCAGSVQLRGKPSVHRPFRHTVSTVQNRPSSHEPFSLIGFATQLPVMASHSPTVQLLFIKEQSLVATMSHLPVLGLQARVSQGDDVHTFGDPPPQLPSAETHVGGSRSVCSTHSDNTTTQMQLGQTKRCIQARHDHSWLVLGSTTADGHVSVSLLYHSLMQKPPTLHFPEKQAVRSGLGCWMH